ncbi:metal ion ABC transporter substrate-binding periplasmic protein [Gluconacetobacter johannae DSM 13595]|uniref:Zinc ABC transporter solute-binding protein n=2 Tax=Gluconacetobacter johannae TaxID=112140 RepID=A0A7W4J9B9_9PROT|nr:zinc ABC transporter solute-binding protein [Gluconacetobacter johannae]GBQ82212.1 metal ion ABC transporter substrate-binding periplasmic protein [Gluconacetobacter johannae DSM 13595]
MLVFALLAAFAVLAGPARAAPLAVVAAETVWGDIARQVGGADVAVTSILTNPSTDPHLFEASPSDGRVVGAARIVIANGGGYDGWIDRLTDAGARARPAMLVVSRRVGWRDGDNPHFWYDLAAVRTVAAAFAETCAELMPDRRAALQDRLGVFLASLSPLQARIDALRARYAGVPAAASEPIFGAMAHAVGLAMQDEAFQRAVMNGTDPAPSDVAALEGDLTSRHVRVLIVNDQTASPVTDRLDGLARAAGVPVLRVGESLPPGLRYQDWIAGTLDRLSQALAPHPDQG